MADEILLEIVTPERPIFSGMVEQVTIPGSEGQFGILKGHTALLSFVDIGELNFIKEGKRRHYAVNTGFVEVDSNKVKMLVETAEEATAIDKERAQRARERAVQALIEVSPKATEDHEKLKAALMRAVTRINVAGRS